MCGYFAAQALLRRHPLRRGLSAAGARVPLG
jgi:hypothetical protein